ncbi:MAG: hypothetical protein ACYSWO_28195 [Planctomycetota bacterium]
MSDTDTVEAGARLAHGAMDRVEERGVARTEEAKEALAEMSQLADVVGIPSDRRALFLRELSRSPVVGRAARFAGLSLSGLYRLKREDERFSAAWDEALTLAVDDIEQAAIDRALEKSDKLLEMILKAKRPEEYRERVDVKVAAVGRIEVDLVPMDPSP